MGAELIDERREESGPRTVAFFAVALSTVAVTVCLITFPMALYYVQTLQSEVQGDVDLCKIRARDLWKEMADMQQGVGANADTVAKAVSFIKTADPTADTSQFMVRKKRQSYVACCTCHRGAAGAPGVSGADGSNGSPGLDGPPGDNGSPAPLNYNPQDLIPPQCPCEADSGSPGNNGPRGPAGPPGQPGANGNDGSAGDNGPQGQSGPPGPPGQAGPKGPPGNNGIVVPRTAPQGQPGSPGRAGAPGSGGAPGNSGTDGRPGTPGQPGSSGNAGRPGALGPQGLRGPNGASGAVGGCDHCPPARTSQGY